MTDQLTLLVSATFGMMFIMSIVLLITYLGGFPEGIWRITRTDYFGFTIFNSDGKPIRRVKKMQDITIKSVPHFNYAGRTFYIDSANKARVRGRPNWYYNANNAIPIPIITGIQDSKVFDPMTINRHYRIDIERRIFNLRKDKGSSSILKFGLVIIVVIILVALIGLVFPK